MFASHTNPIPGWQIAFKEEPNQAIEKDYQGYIHTLSPEEQKFAGPIFYFRDGTGQHAIRITIGINGTSWQHVLIYDKDDKRIRVVKYTSGGYRS